MTQTDSLADKACPITAILTKIYGSRGKAIAALKIGRSSVSNWKSWGYFPEYMVGRLLRDASAAGIKLTADQIPTMTNKVAS